MDFEKEGLALWHIAMKHNDTSWMGLLERYGATFQGAETKAECRSPWMLLYMTASFERDLKEMERWLLSKGWPRTFLESDSKEKLVTHNSL